MVVGLPTAMLAMLAMSAYNALAWLPAAALQDLGSLR